MARVPLFRTLDRPGLQRVDGSCSWRQVAAQEWVVDREGEGTDVFFVLHGHLRVVVSVGGRETILRDLEAGEFFGELAALDLKPRSAGIVAITNSLLARMPAAAFRRAIHDHWDVCDQVLAVLVGQIRMLTNRANETSGLSMKHRLWAELLRLARDAPSAPGVQIISPPPTHSELAARVSSHREAVTRELGALERARLIARRRGAIVVLEAAQLHRMVTEAADN